VIRSAFAPVVISEVTIAIFSSSLCWIEERLSSKLYVPKSFSATG